MSWEMVITLVGVGLALFIIASIAGGIYFVIRWRKMGRDFEKRKEGKYAGHICPWPIPKPRDMPPPMPMPQPSQADDSGNRQ